jgi:hypothetical protein
MELPRQFVFQDQIANLFDLIGFSLAAQGLNIDDCSVNFLGQPVRLGIEVRTQDGVHRRLLGDWWRQFYHSLWVLVATKIFPMTATSASAADADLEQTLAPTQNISLL